MPVIDIVTTRPLSDPIRAETLGIEFLGWELPRYFETRLDAIAPGQIRWPGAIPAEDGIDTDGDGTRELIYDLAAPDLIAGWDRTSGPREGLAHILSLADGADAGLSLIVPTARYVADGLAGQDGLARARADITLFLDRLASGAAGPVPRTLTLEIGTEYYATDVWRKNLDVPDLAARFGAVFAALTETADRHAAALGLDVEIAVQTGRFQSADDPGNRDGQFSDNLAFIDAFRAADALQAIDALIWHRYVPGFDAIAWHLDIPAPGADPERSLLITTQDLWQEAAGGPLDLVAGWLSPATRQGTSPQYGAPGLSNILQQYAGLIEAGMDTGSIYGFAVDRAGSLGLRDEIFIGGQLYALMAESLPGLTLIDGYQDNIAPTRDGAPVETGFVNRYVFDGPDQMVIFLAARALPDAGLDLTLTLDTAVVGGVATRLWDPDGIDVLGPGQVGVVGEIAAEPVEIAGDGTVTLRLNHDFEVIRLVLEKPAGAITGTAGRDRLTGTPADETFLALDGDDRIVAGDGEDVLHDGAGRDNLWGGAGVDRYVLAADGQADTIRDFDEGERIDLTAWGPIAPDIQGRGAHTLIRAGAERLVVRDTLPDAVRDALILAETPGIQLGGTAAADRLRAGPGDDLLHDGAGRDLLWGGAGSDTFVLAADDAVDVIKDFALEDRLDLTAWATRFEALDITRDRSGKLRIEHDDEILALDNAGRLLTPGDLGAEQFVF